MPHHPAARDAGWDLLRCVVADVLRSQPLLATAAGPSGGAGGSVRASGATGAEDDAAVRVTALVDLARDGDSEAFGQLYDHYSTAVYRFIYYRVSSAALAEDLRRFGAGRPEAWRCGSKPRSRRSQPWSLTTPSSGSILGRQPVAL